MRFGGSLFLIAVGAVLKWAVSAEVSGVDLRTVGTILLVVGVIGLVVTLAMWTSRRRTTVIRETDRVDGASRPRYESEV